VPRPRSAGLNAVSRRLPDGSVTHDWYHRPTGRLLGRERDGMTRPQALALAAELKAERLAPQGPPQGSFGELAVTYLSSLQYRGLAPRTRAEYADHIEIMRAAWETVPLAGITRLVVTRLHQGYAATPHRGNAIIRTLRLLLNYGMTELQLRTLRTNPAAGLAMYSTQARTQVWAEPQIDAFLAAAAARSTDRRLRKALALLLYTVQRPADVLAMGRPMMWEDAAGRWWIRLRQAKTGAAIDVPCHRRLAEIMAEPDPPPTPRTQASTLLLPSPRGLQWTIRNFARAWDRVRRRANWRLARAALRARGRLPLEPRARAAAKAALLPALLGDLQRRDLRRTGVVQMALAGATVAQIAALAGWSIDHTARIVETYLPQRGDVALGGVERWEAAVPAGRVVTLAGRRRPVA